MHTITLPQTPASLTDGTVVRWFKQAGDPVASGDVLVEVQTQRDRVHIQADRDGVLTEILAGPGTTLRPGEPLARLDDPGAAPATAPTAEAAPATASAPQPDGVVTVIMPKAGNTMEEGTIITWHVKEGDTIAVGDVLFEVETDKAAVEVEATDAGRLARIVANEGDIVPIFDPVAYLADDDAAVDAYLAAQGGATTGTAPAPAAEAAPAAVPDGVVPVIMPKAGNTMEEGTIITWRVKAGDTIAVGDVLFEVETDKAAVEVEATDAGRLARIVADEGDIVAVFDPVAYLADDDATVDAYLAAQPSTTAAPAPAAPAAAATAASAPSVAQAPAARTAGGRVKASPAARKLAAERGIDLAAIGAGSGPGGRILSSDVPATSPAAAPRPAAVAGQAGRTPMSSMRRAIAGNLQASKQTIPHFYMEITVGADAMMDFYRGEKAKYKCSVNDVVVRAVSTAIAELPALRSQVDGNDVITHPNANIGIAVGIDEGLVVPVLAAAEHLSLQQLAVETRRIVEAARNGKIANMGRGVFTISNMGMFGIHRFSAIINPPESGILAVGAVREDTVVTDGAIKAAKVMTMTLSCDHRIVDGLVAAQFLGRIKELLEEPTLLA